MQWWKKIKYVIELLLWGITTYRRPCSVILDTAIIACATIEEVQGMGERKLGFLLYDVKIPCDTVLPAHNNRVGLTLNGRVVLLSKTTTRILTERVEGVIELFVYGTELKHVLNQEPNEEEQCDF